MKAKSSKRSRAGKLLFKLLLLACLLAVAFVFRAPLLRGLADVWIATEPMVEADAIVILGGGLETRPFEAAKLAHAPRQHAA